jgi:hypothetical protein
MLQPEIAESRGPSAAMKIGAAVILVAHEYQAGVALNSELYLLSTTPIEVCAAPSADSVKAVEEMLAHPPQLPSPTAEGRFARNQQSFQYLDEADHRLGIHYPLMDNELRNELISMDSMEKHSFQEYFSFAQSVLSQLGIVLQQGLNPRITVDAQDPTEAELEDAKAKEMLLALADFYSRQSIERIASLGIEEID